MFFKIGILKNVANFTGKHLFKERLTQALPCKILEIFKNIFFYRTPPVTASENYKNIKKVSGT